MFAKLMGLKTISPHDLMKAVQERSVICFDLNSHDSWSRAHVPGALHLDPGSWSASHLPADRETPLVFYCSNMFCRKAPNAARSAVDMGYQNVRVMSAGISGWLERSLPTERASSVSSPGD